MYIAHSTILLVTLLTFCQGEPSYNHYLPARYYTTTRIYNKPYTDDNVYITDKYGNTVAVEPYWARSSKSYEYSAPANYVTPRCYNCVVRSYKYDPYPYTRKVYVKDRYGNTVLVNPYYNEVSYPSYRSGKYYSSGRTYSPNQDYVYVNDMYGRTRAVPKSSYLYEYAKGY